MPTWARSSSTVPSPTMRPRLSRGSTLCERKHDPLQAAFNHPGLPAQFVERALADHAAEAEQHQAVADARGVGELVDREKERAVAARDLAQERHYVARLAEVETVEGLIQ